MFKVDYIHRRAAESAEIIFLLFSVEMDGKQQAQALQRTNERQSIFDLLVFLSIAKRLRSFLFCPLSRKEIIFSLRDLCVLSEAGGKKVLEL
ncbi:MAG: hypothetical protein MUO43_05965 [Desulfobacterales bacterium]|nr:hypothetical protein [Desulfobacterales bacterium]